MFSSHYSYVLVRFVLTYWYRGKGWLYSIFLLCRIIDMACCIVMVLISLNVCLMVVSGILKFVSRSFIEGACVVPIAHIVMTMSGSIFHPKSIMLFKRGWYL